MPLSILLNCFFKKFSLHAVEGLSSGSLYNNRTMASLTTDDDPSWETHLATDAELELLKEYRIKLGNNLTTEPHSNYPEVTGEYNLLRYIRGNNHNVDDAVKHFLGKF